MECTDRIMADAAKGATATLPNHEQITQMRALFMKDFEANPSLLQSGARTMRLAIQRQFN